MNLIPSRPSGATDFGTDEFGYYADMTVNKGVQRFRYCPPGSFMMGSPEDEPGRFADEGPQHTVFLTNGFWIGNTPVTQALWTATGRQNPSRFNGDKRPVESVNWHDAMAFCAELGCQLPTEAQWEYACRAGTTYNTNKLLDDLAWYYANSKGETRPVARKNPNPRGLYDMLGNVWEWCLDSRHDYAAADVDDPCVENGGSRVIRGGSCLSVARDVRAAYRFWIDPGVAVVDLGFRLLKPAE